MFGRADFGCFLLLSDTDRRKPKIQVRLIKKKGECRSQNRFQYQKYTKGTIETKKTNSSKDQKKKGELKKTVLKLIIVNKTM